MTSGSTRNSPRNGASKHNTQVVVDHISAAEIRARAAAEVAAQKGHDLFMFLDPPAVYESAGDRAQRDHPGNRAQARQDGRSGPEEHLSTRRRKNILASPIIGFPTRETTVKTSGMRSACFPIRGMTCGSVGRRSNSKSGNPVGIGLSQELDTSMAMRAIMYSFGSHEQNEEGQLTINSKETLEAVKFVRALYQEAMTPEVFTWDVSSNNRFMLAGKGSFAMNAISITRSAEKGRARRCPKKIQLVQDPGWTGAPHGIRARHECVCDLEVRREQRRAPSNFSSISSTTTGRLSWRASFTISPAFRRRCPTCRS